MNTFVGNDLYDSFVIFLHHSYSYFSTPSLPIPNPQLSSIPFSLSLYKFNTVWVFSLSHQPPTRDTQSRTTTTQRGTITHEAANALKKSKFVQIYGNKVKLSDFFCRYVRKTKNAKLYFPLPFLKKSHIFVALFLTFPKDFDSSITDF